MKLCKVGTKRLLFINCYTVTNLAEDSFMQFYLYLVFYCSL